MNSPFLASRVKSSQCIFSTKVDKMYKELWVQKLTRQISDHLRSNLTWLGIGESSSASVRLLDYACGTGSVSKVRPHFSCKLRTAVGE